MNSKGSVGHLHAHAFRPSTKHVVPIADSVDQKPHLLPCVLLSSEHVSLVVTKGLWSSLINVSLVPSSVNPRKTAALTLWSPFESRTLVQCLEQNRN